MNSIIQSEKQCYLCGRNGAIDPLDIHHVFAGAYRQKSEQYGLKVYLCHNRCHIFGPDAIHNNADNDRALRMKAQKIAMERYQWNEEEFRQIFGKNYF